MKNTKPPHKFWRLFWFACLSYFFRLKYVWFPVHLDTGQIPNSSGQLAELIVHIIPQEYICIVTRSYYDDIVYVMATAQGEHRSEFELIVNIP